MKALSMSQPWASAVVLDEKSIETRSWKTNYRGTLLIHASARFTTEQKRLVDERELPFTSPVTSAILPTGAIIGAVTVYDCIPTEQIRDDLPTVELKFGDYSDGRWAWLLHDVVRFLKTIPCKGALQLWDVPADIEKQVLEQLSVSRVA